MISNVSFNTINKNPYDCIVFSLFNKLQLIGVKLDNIKEDQHYI